MIQSYFLTFALIGLANIAGSLIAGQAVNRYRSKYILFWMYGSRAVLILLYLASTLYHSFTNLKVKSVFKVIDHAAIFVLIAGNYTPFALIPLHGSFGWTIFGLVWGMALVGIVFQCFAAKRFRIVRTLCYLGMGWFAVFMVKPLLESLPIEAIWWLVAGGLCYSVGAIFYLARRLPYSHVIWHLFVMGGSAIHFYTVFHFVLPLPEVVRSAIAMI